MIGFRKSLKVAPGIRLTLSRGGGSVSAGPRGAKVAVNTRKQRRASFGLAGFFWRKLF